MMTDKYLHMLANAAIVVGSVQSGENINISGRDENGFLIIDNQNDKYHLVNQNNYFDGDLSGEAFRLALTILAASSLSIESYQRGIHDVSEYMSNLYVKATDYAYKNLSNDEAANLAAYLD